MTEELAMTNQKTILFNIHHFRSVSSPSLLLVEWGSQRCETGFKTAFHDCSTVNGAKLI
jgi:hypothetical protein